MNVAVLYDIHGNLPALEAVLDEVAREGAEMVVVGGDVVPGPMAGGVLEALGAFPAPVRCIRGNGEADVLQVAGGEVPTRVPEPFHAVLRWVADALAPAQVDELAGWPATLTLDVPGVGRVLFCHATPRDDNEIFTRLTPVERLEAVFADVDADVVVCGHTHMPFDRRVGHVRVVNAGSVGMPFGEPGASWLALGSGVEPRTTPYDLEAAARRIADSGYPSEPPFEVRDPPSEDAMLAMFERAALR